MSKALLSKKLRRRYDIEGYVMSKKVLIISTSIRPNSNSRSLANAFAEGAREAGNAGSRLYGTARMIEALNRRRNCFSP